MLKNRRPYPDRRPGRPTVSPFLRRLAGSAAVLALFLAVLTGIAAVGVMTTMGQSYPAAPSPAGEQAWPAPRPIPDGSRTVAVVLGDTGSVAADVLAPSEVFARSTGFFLYTVGRTRSPMTLPGGDRREKARGSGVTTPSARPCPVRDPLLGGGCTTPRSGCGWAGPAW
jgi:hypothetical protein